MHARAARRRPADALDVQVVLLRPERRDGRVALVRAGGVPSGDRALVLRVQPVLQADEPLRTGKAHAVAGGENRAVGRSALRVYDDAVVSREARGRRKRVVGFRSGADDDDVGDEALAGAGDRCDSAVPLRRRRQERRPDADVHAVPCVRLVNGAADLLVAHTRENAGRDFQHRHLHAQHRAGRGDLQTDQSAADDEQVATTGKRRLQHAGIGFGTEVIRAGRADWKLRDLARRRAGRNHERLVRQASAVGEHDNVPGPIDPCAVCRGFEDDPVAGHAARPGDWRVFRRDAAEQHRLRQRRFLVRLAAFSCEQRDGGVGILLPRRNCCKGTGGTAADYNDAHQPTRPT